MNKKITLVAYIFLLFAAVACTIFFFRGGTSLQSSLFPSTTSVTSLLYNGNFEEDKNQDFFPDGWHLKQCNLEGIVPNSEGIAGKGFTIQTPVCLSQFQPVRLPKGANLKAEVSVYNEGTTAAPINIAIVHNDGSDTPNMMDERSLTVAMVAPGTWQTIQTSLPLVMESRESTLAIGLVITNSLNAKVKIDNAELQVDQSIMWTPTANTTNSFTTIKNPYSTSFTELSQVTPGTATEFLSDKDFIRSEGILPESWISESCPDFASQYASGKSGKAYPMNFKQCLWQVSDIPMNVLFDSLSGLISVKTSQNVTAELTIRYAANFGENAVWQIQKNSVSLIKDTWSTINTQMITDQYTPFTKKRALFVLSLPDNVSFTVKNASLKPVKTLSPAEATAVAAFKESGVLQQGHVILDMNPADTALLQDPIRYMKALNLVYDTYKNMLGGAPYNDRPITVMSKCDYNASIADPDTPTATCPNGYMRWNIAGGAGETTIVADTYFKQSLDVFNKTGAMSLLVAHEFGHNFDTVTSAPQYMFNGPSVESFANIKVVALIDRGPQPVEFQNKVYMTSGEMMTGNGFYAQFYPRYKSNNYTFASLMEGQNISNQSDLYLSILMRVAALIGDNKQSLFDTLRLYKTGETTLRSIVKLSPAERMNQFVYFWSAVAKKDLSPYFIEDRFPISETTKSLITQYLALPVLEKTDQKIIDLDKATYANNIPANIKTAFQMKQSSLSQSFYMLGDINMKDGYYIQEFKVNSNDGLGILMYNASLGKIFVVPWWNYDLISADPLLTKYGSPKEDYYYNVSNGYGWTQNFEKGRFIWRSGESLQFVPS
ncbi:MAG: hypothetical protein ACK4NC_01055 [Candidatus Gracilibacteria bacterium]